MKLVEMNWRPTVRQLRQFAATALVMLPLLGWLWGGGNHTLAALACLGALLLGLSLVVPRAVKPIYLAVTLLALPIGIVMGELTLLAIFYGVFVPIGFAFRYVRHDPMDRRWDRGAETYWLPKQQPRDAGSYLRMS
jgi:hypothetical protein